MWYVLSLKRLWFQFDICEVRRVLFFIEIVSQDPSICSLEWLIYLWKISRALKGTSTWVLWFIPFSNQYFILWGGYVVFFWCEAPSIASVPEDFDRGTCWQSEPTLVVRGICNIEKFNIVKARQLGYHQLSAYNTCVQNKNWACWRVFHNFEISMQTQTQPMKTS